MNSEESKHNDSEVTLKVLTYQILGLNYDTMQAIATILMLPEIIEREGGAKTTITIAYEERDESPSEEIVVGTITIQHIKTICGAMLTLTSYQAKEINTFFSKEGQTQIWEKSAITTIHYNKE